MSTPSKHLRAPQATSIDTHARREAILKDIAEDRGSSGVIARRYGLSVVTIRQYRANWLRELIAKNREEKGMRTAEGIMSKLDSQVDKVTRITDSMEHYLEDPDDPSKLWMGLQAEELIICYADPDDPKRRRKGMLSEVLRTAGLNAFDFTVKRDDTRRLYHDAIRLNLELVDRFAKIQGLVKDIHVNISRTETWSFVMADIIKATEKFPEAREAIISMFEEKAKALPEATE